MRYLRLVKIDQIIGSGRYPSVQSLADECECTSRQLHRDLGYLRDFCERRLAHSRVRNGYYYEEPPTQCIASLLGLGPDLGRLEQFQEAIRKQLQLCVQTAGSDRSHLVVPFAILAVKRVTVVLAASIPGLHPQCFQLDRVHIVRAQPLDQELPPQTSARLFETYARGLGVGNEAPSLTE